MKLTGEYEICLPTRDEKTPLQRQREIPCCHWHCYWESITSVLELQIEEQLSIDLECLKVFW